MAEIVTVLKTFIPKMPEMTEECYVLGELVVHAFGNVLRAQQTGCERDTNRP